jgi:hypothetical protein
MGTKSDHILKINIKKQSCYNRKDLKRYLISPSSFWFSLDKQQQFVL